jgi:hypothetical protein
MISQAITAGMGRSAADLPWMKSVRRRMKELENGTDSPANQGKLVVTLPTTVS